MEILEADERLPTDRLRWTPDAGAGAVGVVMTNFNNSALTARAVKSLAEGAGWHATAVVIVDNASDANEVRLLRAVQAKWPEITLILSDQNTGYFGGLNIGIRHLRGVWPGIKWVVVGNNDLQFSADFIEELLTCGAGLSTWAVIAPDLVTPEGRHQNPHVREGVSLRREFLWDLYATAYPIALFMRIVAGALGDATRRRDQRSHGRPGVIRLGYGACYVLGPRFFERYEELWAPTLLMGEEYFLACQLSAAGLETYYEPRLRVMHHDHATMKKLPSRATWELWRESHSVYRRRVRMPWTRRPE